MQEATAERDDLEAKAVSPVKIVTRPNSQHPVEAGQNPKRHPVAPNIMQTRAHLVDPNQTIDGRCARNDDLAFCTTPRARNSASPMPSGGSSNAGPPSSLSSAIARKAHPSRMRRNHLLSACREPGISPVAALKETRLWGSPQNRHRQEVLARAILLARRRCSIGSPIAATSSKPETTSSASRTARRKPPNPQRRSHELDQRLTLKPSSSRVSSQWQPRVRSRRKSTQGRSHHENSG